MKGFHQYRTSKLIQDMYVLYLLIMKKTTPNRHTQARYRVLDFGCVLSMQAGKREESHQEYYRLYRLHNTPILVHIHTPASWGFYRG